MKETKSVGSKASPGHDSMARKPYTTDGSALIASRVPASKETVVMDLSPAKQLTSHFHSLTRLSRFNLRGTISDLKSTTRYACHSAGRKPQQTVNKASIKGPYDFRCISGGVGGRLEASFQSVESAQLLPNKNEHTKTKLLRNGRPHDGSDCEGDELRFAPMCDSLDNNEPDLAASSHPRGYSLRGGGGASLNLAAKRDKVRNSSNPQTKVSPPKTDVIRRNNIVSHDSEGEKPGLLDPDDGKEQVNDALTGLWNKQYSKPSRVPDQALLPSALWWVAGGKPGASSKPKDVGSLREMRRAAKPAGVRPGVDGKTQARGFWEECKYVLTDGRDSGKRKTVRGSQEAGQNEEMPQPVYVRERDSIPQRVTEAASSCSPSTGHNRGREHQAIDRTRSRSRTSTWSESSDSHSPADRLSQ